MAVYSLSSIFCTQSQFIHRQSIEGNKCKGAFEERHDRAWCVSRRKVSELSPEMGRMVCQCSIHLPTHQVVHHVITEHLLRAKHCSGPWEYSYEQIGQSSLPHWSSHNHNNGEEREYCFGENVMILFLDLLAPRYNFQMKTPNGPQTL